MNLSWNFENSDKLLNTTKSINSTEIFEDDVSLMIFTIIWPLIAIVGILANLCVILVLSAKLKSATQYFIINLAISDMLFLMICPTMALINLHQLINYNDLPNIIANIICKLDYYLTHLTVFITCLTLMSMTFDRYMVIMHPLKSLSYRSKSKAVLINLGIWLLSMILSVPHGLFRVIKVNNQTKFCSNSEEIEETLIDLKFTAINLSQLNIIYTILIAYIIPFVTIVFCYLIMMNQLTKEKPVLNDTRYNTMELQKRRRVLIMIALVTILFGITWLPIHCFLFALKFFRDFPYGNEILFSIKNLAHTLTYLNSMLNPFFYTIMGDNFRKQIFAHKAKYSSRLKSYYPRNASRNSASNHSSICKANFLQPQESLCLSKFVNIDAGDTISLSNNKNNLQSIEKFNTDVIFKLKKNRKNC